MNPQIEAAISEYMKTIAELSARLANAAVEIVSLKIELEKIKGIRNDP